MTRTKRWAASEHSRIVSGVFAKSVRGGDEDREGAIVRNATFGLARVQLRSLQNLGLSKSSSVRSALRRRNRVHPSGGAKSANSSVGGKHDDKRPPARVGGVRKVRRWFRKALGFKITARNETLWQVAGFVDSLFVLFTVPLRIGFFFDPWNQGCRQTTWTSALTLFSVLDVLFSALRILMARKQLKLLLRNIFFLCCFGALERNQRDFSVLRALRASFPDDDATMRSGRSGFSARGDRVAPYDAVPMQRKMKLHQQHLKPSWLVALAQILYVFPWEFGCVLINYNWMHLVGAARFLQAVYNVPKQFNVVFFTHFRTTKVVQWLSFSTVAIVVYLICVGLYLCHLAAAGYIFLAHWECDLEFSHCQKYPFPQSWVLRDNLERGSMVRKYVRTLYWACKTVTTLGQGDLVPATNTETLYRIIVQFLSGLWATAILTAYSFYFSHKDANMTTNISTRRQQAVQYMERTRNGVEEELILSDLPLHYRTQCLHYVKFKCFRRITIFKNRQGAFLRTLLNLLEKDFFAPNQVVLQVREPEDMLIVAAGEIRIMDGKSAVKGRLTTGNAYAEYALFEDHLSNNLLIADTYCELWCLTRRAFKVALRKHFSKLMYASILAQKFGVDSKRIPFIGNAENAARMNSLKSMEASARMVKVLGNGSAVMNKMVQKISRDASSEAEKIPEWRQPNSLFQFIWLRIECGLLLVLIAEVPYQIAFQRGFGLLNSEEQPVYGAVPFIIQQADFFLSIWIELFFYVDLYFRARCFVRPALNRREQKEEEEHNNMSAVAMISDKSQIFRHYRANDNYWMDVLTHLPIALMWDVAPKEWFSPRTTQYIRFVRVLRLLRARKLKTMLKTLMLEHGVATYIRLLVYIVVFVVSAAHCAGCLFFLVADVDVFHGGLPAEGVLPGIISTPRCLEDASLFGNCTWYMYDRSTFNVDAPYLRSLHWSLVLLSTVGYGDILSFTTKECVAGCIWIFFGANICYFTGSALSSVLAQVSILATIRHERVEEINLVLMRMTTVSEQTKNTLRSYYETKWKLNGSAVHDEEVVSHLPRSLRRQVACSLFVEDIRRCWIFADSTESLLLVQQLAQAARCEIFLSNSFAIREGHLATEFFIIQSGDAERLLPPLKSTSVGLSNVRPPRGSSTKADLYNRQGLTMVASPAAANVDGSLSKLATPLNLAKQSSRGLFPTSSGVPKLINVKSKASMRSQSRTLSRSQTLGTLMEFISSSTPRFEDENQHVPRRGSAERRQLVWRLGGKRASTNGDGFISVSVLKKDDFFGEESLASKSDDEMYQVSVRVLSTIQVIVIRRQDFHSLSARFSQQFERILNRRRRHTKEDEKLLNTLRANFYVKEKLAKWLGPTSSLNLESKGASTERKGRRTLDPETPFARWWHRITGGILVYNFYMIVFRIAFLPYPSERVMTWLTFVDYAIDILLYLDIYLKHQHLGYSEYGQKVLDPIAIRKRYRRGWFAQDCWSMVPTYYRGDYFYMTAARVPRLLRSRQLATLLDEVHTEIQQHFLKGNAVLSNVFDLVKFILIFVSTAHYIGSLYYLLGRLQLDIGIVDKSWINCDFILDQYPNDPLVHYMRAMYWCLSTFTVDCFGDVLARNFLESCFAGFTCVLGWIFVGQVIGRINSLMITLDQDAKQRHERVEDFEQYAKQRNLPLSLRLRAMQSLAYKSECLLDLKAVDVFSDLPGALRVQLFYEMYGSFIKDAPLFHKMTTAQLEAIASVLYVEIYLHGDLIFEGGRTGAKLFIMKTGRAEVFAPDSGIVYAAMEAGAVFGEFSFFIPCATRLASSRAVRSCQVLQLDKHKWNRIWPRAIRLQIEAHLVPYVKAKYVQTSKIYMNIAKNFSTKNEKAMPSAPAPRTPPPPARHPVKVHPAPPGNSDTSANATAIGPLTKFHEQKPTQRRSFSVEPAAALKFPSSPEARVRRRTMLEQSNLKSMHELTGIPALSTEVASSPTIPPELPPSSNAPFSATAVESFTAVQPSHGGSVPATPGSGSVLTKRISQSSLARRSLFPPVKRPSSMSVLAKTLGFKEAVAEGNSEGEDAGRKEVETKGLSREESKVSMLQTRSVLLLDAPPLVETEKLQLEGLSPASESRWKRHSKRLMALLNFHKGFLKVQDAVSDDAAQRARRRASLAVVPTYCDGNVSEDVLHAREGLTASFRVRRHSLQGDRKELEAKLLTLGEFEKKLTTAVEVPPAVEITPTNVNSHRRRNSTFASSSSRRMSALGSRTETPSPAADNLWAVRGPYSWWKGLFSQHKKTKHQASVSPQPAAPVAAEQDQAQVNSSKYQIWAELPPPSPFFLHNSMFRHCWHILMLSITLYYIFIIPFRIGFLHEYLSDPTHVLTVEMWFVVEYLFTDAFCVVDFILHRSYFVYLDAGEVVSDRQAIAAHYWYRGSFVVDLLSIAPLEILAIVGVYATTPLESLYGQPPQTLWHTLSLCRINRFLRGVHFHSLLDKVERFLLYDLKIAIIRPSLFYLLQLALDFAMGTHWVACLFYGISYLSYAENRPSWLTAPGMLLFEGCKDFAAVAHVPVAVAYLRSLHFSIGAITTVCYGDILPMNAIENVVTLAVVFISVAFFSMLSGGFFKFFERELGKRAEYEEKVAQVGHFMVFHQFPARTWKQMQVYFALSWQESKGMQEDQMLRGLTATMRQEIALHVHANLMKHVRLFTHTDEQFARVVIAALKHELFVRNDVIIQRGDMGRSLYIIETGLVSICVVRNMYARGSTNEGAADSRETQHRSSVTEWVSKAAMSLADAQRVVAAGAISGVVSGDGGITGNNHPAALVPLSDIRPARINGRKVMQREEKFVKGPFDYFGERSLLFGTPRNATCIALCVCSLFVLTVDRFEAILKEFPWYRTQCIRAWVMNRNMTATK